MSIVDGSSIDIVIFFGPAFAPTFDGIDKAFGMQHSSLDTTTTLFGSGITLWVTLTLGDFSVKILVGLGMLVPYGLMLKWVKATSSALSFPTLNGGACRAPGQTDRHGPRIRGGHLQVSKGQSPPRWVCPGLPATTDICVGYRTEARGRGS